MRRSWEVEIANDGEACSERTSSQAAAAHLGAHVNDLDVRIVVEHSLVWVRCCGRKPAELQKLALARPAS